MLPVAIEICLSSQSRALRADVERAAAALVARQMLFLAGSDEQLRAQLLAEGFDVEHVLVALPSGLEELAYFRATVRVFAYRLWDEAPSTESIVDESDGSATPIFSSRSLPCREFEGVWENLVLEEGAKDRLLGFSETCLLFSQALVNPLVVSCNRVVLLHGPPGTGKTSLCQGLAQKIAVRQAHAQYAKGVFFLEVNAHSLFSRWFSESGKLVGRLFDMVRNLARDPACLVFILIDEVESLTNARGRNSASDPSDAVRVVNAMLTQIDRLRAFSNVMLLATSNVTDQIDAAFLDRADVKMFLGPPDVGARYQVLRSCLEALTDAGIVHPRDATLMSLGCKDALVEQTENRDDAHHWLVKAAHASQGMSGRALRKLPMQAHAYFVREPRVAPHVMAKAFYSVVVEVACSNTKRR